MPAKASFCNAFLMNLLIPLDD